MDTELIIEIEEAMDDAAELEEAMNSLLPTVDISPMPVGGPSVPPSIQSSTSAFVFLEGIRPLYQLIASYASTFHWVDSHPQRLNGVTDTHWIVTGNASRLDRYGFNGPARNANRVFQSPLHQTEYESLAATAARDADAVYERRRKILSGSSPAAMEAAMNSCPLPYSPVTYTNFMSSREFVAAFTGAPITRSVYYSTYAATAGPPTPNGRSTFTPRRSGAWGGDTAFYAADHNLSAQTLLKYKPSIASAGPWRNLCWMPINRADPSTNSPFWDSTVTTTSRDPLTGERLKLLDTVSYRTKFIDKHVNGTPYVEWIASLRAYQRTHGLSDERLRLILWTDEPK